MYAAGVAKRASLLGKNGVAWGNGGGIGNKTARTITLHPPVWLYRAVTKVQVVDGEWVFQTYDE